MSKLELDITHCKQVYFSGDEQSPTSRDLMFGRGGKFYIISIATPQYVAGLKTYDSQHPEDSAGESNEKFYLMEPIPSIDELCKILSQIPFAQLQPYLEEQKVD